MPLPQSPHSPPSPRNTSPRVAPNGLGNVIARAMILKKKLGYCTLDNTVFKGALHRFGPLFRIALSCSIVHHGVIEGVISRTFLQYHGSRSCFRVHVKRQLEPVSRCHSEWYQSRSSGDSTFDPSDPARHPALPSPIDHTPNDLSNIPSFLNPIP